MHIIQCYRKKNKFENPTLAYVSSGSEPGQGLQFTDKREFAHEFSNLGSCKNIRDDALQHASNVSIINT